jgi:hypothetical protein
MSAISEEKKTQNVTFVTGYYDLSNIPKQDYLNSGVRTLNIRQPMVIYVGDEESYDFITNHRISIGLAEITKVILIPFEELYFYKYRDLINENRAKYWPTSDVRCTTDINIVMFSKFNFIKLSAEHNYFNTTHVGWIDFNLLTKKPHNSDNYTSDEIYAKIDDISRSPKDRFSITILNMWLPSWYDNLRSFYTKYQWICTGLFYTVDIKTCKKIIPRLINYAEYTTLRGYGHGEESIIGHIIDNDLSDFNLSIGDYQDAIGNYYQITSNQRYCNWVISLYRNKHPERYAILLPYINSSTN